MNNVTNKFSCPCCGYKTFNEKPNDTYAVCAVCFWEDSKLQLDNPDYEGGANKVSLREAQINFMKYGACERAMVKNVRQPKKEEKRDKDWKPLE